MPKACPTCRNLFAYGMACPNDGTVLLDIPELDPNAPSPPPTTATEAEPVARQAPRKAVVSHPGRAVLSGVVVMLAFVEIWAWAGGQFTTRPTYLAVAMGVAVALAMHLLGRVTGTRFAIVAAIIVALGCGLGDVVASAFYTAHFSGASPESTLSGLPSILKFGVLDGLTFGVAVVAAFLGVRTGFGGMARPKTSSGPQAR
jgi:hypothetical protein